MRTQKQSRHLIIKIILGGIVLFLVAVGVRDWSPDQQVVEKTVVYEAK